MNTENDDLLAIYQARCRDLQDRLVNLERCAHRVIEAMDSEWAPSSAPNLELALNELRKMSNGEKK